MVELSVEAIVQRECGDQTEPMVQAEELNLLLKEDTRPLSQTPTQRNWVEVCQLPRGSYLREARTRRDVIGPARSRLPWLFTTSKLMNDLGQ